MIVMLLGGVVYVKARVSKSPVPAKDIMFSVKGEVVDVTVQLLMLHVCIKTYAEKRVVHGQTSLVLDSTPVPVFAISPNHGKVEYQWEKKRVFSPNWAPIDVPKWTCILFVEELGSYRCTFENHSFVFEVKRPTQKSKCTSDG